MPSHNVSNCKLCVTLQQLNLWVGVLGKNVAVYLERSSNAVYLLFGKGIWYVEQQI